MGQALARIVPEYRRPVLLHLAAGEAQPCGDGRLQPEGKVVHPLLHAVQQGVHAAFRSTDGKAGEALAGLQELETGCAIQTPVEVLHALGDLMLRLGDQLGRGRGCGSAQVSDKVGDGEVGLVAHGGNHGETARGDRARHPLGVEGGQIFERSAAAREDDQIGQARGVDHLDRGFDLGRRLLALH